MQRNMTYYGFSVNADNFLLPSELRAINEYQNTNIIPSDANEIVKFIISSMFNVDKNYEEYYLCIAIQLSNELKNNVEQNDFKKYDSIIAKELNNLNMLVPRQCYIEWQTPKLFSLEKSFIESH